LRNLLNEISQNPQMGTPIGRSCYKIRLKISSKNTGKVGGARVITYVYVEGETVTLLSIYDKSDQENILDAEIKKRLESLN
jgi:mRNA-degrading endonuclease RelE of RelBE toxin-antitoxin system